MPVSPRLPSTSDLTSVLSFDLNGSLTRRLTSDSSFCFLAGCCEWFIVADDRTPLVSCFVVVVVAAAAVDDFFASVLICNDRFCWFIDDPTNEERIGFKVRRDPCRFVSVVVVVVVVVVFVVLVDVEIGEK